jgi:hypothetical protein
MTIISVMKRAAYDANNDGIVDRAHGAVMITAGPGGINAFQVVIMAPDGSFAIPADGSNYTHAGLVIGMATTDISDGEDGPIKTSGEVVNPDWDLDPGEIYYVGVAGTISKTPAATGFWQKIGVAKDSVTLIISIGEAIKVV